jgi:hypothetical protein
MRCRHRPRDGIGELPRGWSMSALGHKRTYAVQKGMSSRQSDARVASSPGRKQKGTAAFQRVAAIPTIGRNKGPTLFAEFGVSHEHPAFRPRSWLCDRSQVSLNCAFL